MGEASVGERKGQPLSLDKNSNRDADVFHWTEGNADDARDRECPADPAWSQTLACADAPQRQMRGREAVCPVLAKERTDFRYDVDFA
jgi:hypothetical protein